MPSNPPQQFSRPAENPQPVQAVENFVYNPDTDAYDTTGYQLIANGNSITLTTDEARDIAGFILNRTGGEDIPL